MKLGNKNKNYKKTFPVIRNTKNKDPEVGTFFVCLETGRGLMWSRASVGRGLENEIKEVGEVSRG